MQQTNHSGPLKVQICITIKRKEDLDSLAPTRMSDDWRRRGTWKKASMMTGIVKNGREHKAYQSMNCDMQQFFSIHFAWADTLELGNSCLDRMESWDG